MTNIKPSHLNGSSMEQHLEALAKN